MGLNGDISSMQRGVRVKAIGTRRSRSWRSRVRFSSWSFRNVFLVPWLTCSEPEYEGNLWKKKIKEIDGNCNLTLYLVIYCCTMLYHNPKTGNSLFWPTLFRWWRCALNGISAPRPWSLRSLAVDPGAICQRPSLGRAIGQRPLSRQDEVRETMGNHFGTTPLVLTIQIDLTWSNWILSWFSLP